MPLEGGAYIHNLNELWPLSGDVVSQGDDHIRLLKKALWGDGGLSGDGTFRLFTGPITLTSDEVNALPADTAAVQADLELQVTELLLHVVPKGAISMWSGTIGLIPTGYSLCNGVNDPDGGTTPDLTDKFIIGAGSTYAPGATAVGTGSTGVGGAHDHGGTTQGTSLTVANIPDLTGALQIQSDYIASSAADSHYEQNWVAGGRSVAKAWITGPIRSDTALMLGSAHTHVIDAETDHSHTQELPDYYALAFIIKYTEYEDPSP